MTLELIRKSSTDFRNGIEACVLSLGIEFESFPRGSCGAVNPMLGTYLIELGLGEFQYFTGDYGLYEEGTWWPHAWLQSDDFVVDITADQFPEITEKVIVETQSKWHENLNGRALTLADYRIYDLPTVSNLGPQYQKIIECINGA